MRNYAGTCKSICSYNLVHNFLIQLLPLKRSVFVVHFSNAFQHGNEAFPEVSFQNEIVSLLVIFHLPYSKYRSVKICFYSCRSCRTRVALVQHSCCTHVARIWHPCCKLDQIGNNIGPIFLAFLLCQVKKQIKNLLCTIS